MLDASYALTTESDLSCPHGGTVQFQDTLNNKLTVGKKPVLLQGDIVDATINRCSLQDSNSPPTKQCKKVASITEGGAKKLTIGKKAVMLSDPNNKPIGTTDGGSPPPGSPPPPPGAPLSVTSTQHKLTAT